MAFARRSKRICFVGFTNLMLNIALLSSRCNAFGATGTLPLKLACRLASTLVSTVSVLI